MPALDRDSALEALSRLHAHKNAGYGNAWRKRGEVLSIFSNLARKYDRLIVALDQGVDAGDERVLDTAGDLCVYAAKYLTWLAATNPDAFDTSSSVTATRCADEGGTKALNVVLSALQPMIGTVEECWIAVKGSFAPLEVGLIAQSEGEGAFDWGRKVELAWLVAAASAGLLIALGGNDEKGATQWLAEIEAMG